MRNACFLTALDQEEENCCGYKGRLVCVVPSPELCQHLPKNITFKSYSAKVIYLNFHPREVVTRYRDPQLQVDKTYSYLINLRQNICKS